MPPLSLVKRQEIVNRVSGGQRISGPAGIAKQMGVSIKTIYKLLRSFKQQDGSYIVTPARIARKQSLTREHLVFLSETLQASPKMTLAELRQQLVNEGHFTTLDDVPDSSTIWRRLQLMGFQYRKPVYAKTNSVRSGISHERCAFRAAQDTNTLDPTSLLSIDESNFYFEQATRSWGSTAKPATLTSDTVMRRSLIATIAFQIVGGEKRAIIHWKLVPPRRTWRPLSDEIEAVELSPNEAADIRTALTSEQHIKSLNCEGLKGKLKQLGIRSTHTSQQSMREALIRVWKTKSRLGMKRARNRGRPSAGGACEAPVGDARMVSEYLFSCLVPYLKTGELKNGDGFDCKGATADEGIEQCPSGGKKEANVDLKQLKICWDNAPSHLPSTHISITPFEKYAKEKLALAGVVQIPPLSPQFQPIELFFSYVKRYCRKFTVPDTEALVKRLREATQKVTGDMIAGWFKKCGFLIPGDPEDQERPADPNEGVVDRCALPKDARFEAREHIACFSKDGKLRREKKKGARTWSHYEETNEEEEKQEGEEDRGDLVDLSVAGRKAIRPQKRVKVAECAQPGDGSVPRWVGIGPQPPGIPHAQSTDLWDSDSYHAVEAVVGERQNGNRTEYLIKWRGYDDTYNEWVTADRFSAGASSLLRSWQERNRRLQERKEMKTNEHKSQENDKKNKAEEEVRPINRTNIHVGDVIAVLASNSAAVPFYLAKVLALLKEQQKLRVHWFKSQAADANYLLEYKLGRQQQQQRLPGTVGASSQHKAKATPHVALIWEHAVIDTAPSMKGKQRGKLSRLDLTRLSTLAEEARAKNRG
jgi:transposase